MPFRVDFLNALLGRDSPPPPNTPPQRYLLDSRLYGYAPVFAMAASSTGDILAIGSEDGIRLRDLKDNYDVSAPVQMSANLRQVSAIRWITGPDDPWETLCFGTGCGWLFFWRQNIRLACFEELTSRRLGNGSEITCLAYDRAPLCTFRVAVGYRDQVVQVWMLDANTSLTSIYSIVLENTIPKALTFFGASNDNLDARKVCVLGFLDGKLIRLHETTGEVIDTKEITSRVGNADFCEEMNMCVIDNTFDGFDVHNFDTGAFLRTLKTDPTARSFPRQVALAENGAMIVGGSVAKHVYIFDRLTGERVQVLSHSSIGRCQTITVFSRKHDHYIATASSDDTEGVRVHIWKYSAAVPRRQADIKHHRASKSTCNLFFVWLLRILIIMLFSGGILLIREYVDHKETELSSRQKTLRNFQTLANNLRTSQREATYKYDPFWDDPDWNPYSSQTVIEDPPIRYDAQTIGQHAAWPTHTSPNKGNDVEAHSEIMLPSLSPSIPEDVMEKLFKTLLDKVVDVSYHITHHEGIPSEGQSATQAVVGDTDVRVSIEGDTDVRVSIEPDLGMEARSTGGDDEMNE